MKMDSVGPTSNEHLLYVVTRGHKHRVPGLEKGMTQNEKQPRAVAEVAR